MPIIGIEGLEESSSELRVKIADGQYPAVIRSIEQKPTAKGGERLNVTCQIVGGDYDEELQWISLAIPNNTMTARGQDLCKRAIKRFIVACGAEDEIADGRFDTSLLVGRNITLVIGQKNGDSQVKDYLPAM